MTKPESTVDRKKRIAKIVAERTVNRILTLRDKMGIHPWDETGELTPEQRRGRFILTMDDEHFWKKLIEADRQLFHLDPDRTPKRLWDEACALYKQVMEERAPQRERERKQAEEEETTDGAVE